ncbi:carbohydrate-binding module family 20 protein [Athelia psychrophila]|uniref:Alpha-amylase n=1 Tax=Athelia psychrophila TaxID=1759441 RepID=A0A165WS59_9AGAM|nr:carbohydrate-binding module family 20 protein [Fibularhizoctonia sp. CBS 109695]
MHPAYIVGGVFSVLLPALAAPATGNNMQARYPTTGQSKDVIIQLFQWNWNSVAAECTTFIGPAGYGFAQVSPAQESIQGAQWSSSYSPVSYIIDNKLGTRAEYEAMVSACNAAGVGVIADAVLNHMSGSAFGEPGDAAGSTFSTFAYPAVPWVADNFHYCGDGNDGSGDSNWVDDYTNRTNVQQCELGGLEDLATDTASVRTIQAAYLNDLMSLGVKGFRFDAATWIAAADLAAIVGQLKTKATYITQETHWIEDCPILPTEYTSIGDAQEFRYVVALKAAFLGSSSSISTLENLNSQGWVDGSVANVFVATHDTERDGTSLIYSSPDNTYITASVFSLAHSYGTPTILSSYSFSDTNAGAPNSNTGVCSGSGGLDGWNCQHRYVAITGMVGFHNTASASAVVNWAAGSDQQIAFGRGSVAFVAINNDVQPWSQAFATGLPAGIYCDVIHGSVVSGVCSSVAYTVSSSGILNITVSARDAIAVHTNAVVKASTVSSVTFKEVETTSNGDNVLVVGSISQLGSWGASAAIPMTAYGYPTWSTTLNLPASTAFEYKFVKLLANGTAVFEDGDNRSATTPTAGGSLTISDTWQ